MRLLTGALVSAAASSARPRVARGARTTPLDECDHPLRCVGKKTCGIRDPNAGPSAIPVCIVTCCTADYPVCCKAPGYSGPFNLRAPYTSAPAKAPYGTTWCCAAGHSCGDPATTPCGRAKTCGPDITDQLGEALNRVRSTFGKWSSIERFAACTALVQTPIGAVGWEINQLGPGNRDEGAKNLQPDCATCGGSLSVQVGSGCHAAGSVNYSVYGVMLRLCHDHYDNSLKGEAKWFTEEQMAHYITVWKKLRGAPNLAPSLAWAREGYNGWPDRGSVPGPEHPGCAKCPKQFPGRLTVRWLPLGLNI